MIRQKSLIRTIFEPIAIAIALAVAVRACVEMYSIPSDSMAPTLTAGDQIVVTPYFGAAPQRGDIVVFRAPFGEGEVLVKRVVGVPGDLIDSRMGRVRIGGYTLSEPYLIRSAAAGAIAPQVVPPDSYYVLGDNRDDSVDSRSWGAVPRPLISGRARMVLWSSALPLDGAAQAAGRQTPHRHRDARSRLFKWLH